MQSLLSTRNGISGILACLLLVTVTETQAARFEVRDATTRLVGGVYVVDAVFRFEFSEESIEALENGVRLTVTIDMQIVRHRKYLWAKRITQRQTRWSLEVHPLSGQYVLKNLDSGSVRAFPTLDGATTAMSALKAFRLSDDRIPKEEGPYHLRVRARLDIEALPAPLRPLAYLSAPWRLTSEWSEWPIEP
jgi:hypothetical protein